MRRLGTAAVVALLAGAAWLGASAVTSPARAQMPNINLIPNAPSKSPEEVEAEENRDKAYKESLRKIPEAKAPSDPWGGVRSSDAPKTSTTRAPAKKTKTGSSVN